MRYFSYPDLRNVKTPQSPQIAAQSTRQLSTTAAKASKGEVAEGYLKLKDVQARFQVSDDTKYQPRKPRP